MKKTYQRLEFLNEKIYQYGKTTHDKPQVFAMREDGAIPNPNDSRWEEFPYSKTWGSVPNTHVWFLIRYPQTTFGRGIPVLGVSTGTTDDDWNVCNPQFIAYIDGKAVQALDANHREIFLDGRENKEIVLHGYNGLKRPTDIRMQVELFEYDKPSLDLYYAVFVLLKILELSEVKSKVFTFIIRNLKEILGKIDFTIAYTEAYYQQIRVANDKIQNELLPLLRDEFNPTAYAVGTSHLDVAWLWTVEQTREKAQRTAATALEYMRIFPQYKFFGSQAVLYKYIKEDAPALFEEIKKQVKEKRWNVGGGTCT